MFLLDLQLAVERLFECAHRGSGGLALGGDADGIGLRLAGGLSAGGFVAQFLQPRQRHRQLVIGHALGRLRAGRQVAIGVGIALRLVLRLHPRQPGLCRPHRGLGHLDGGIGRDHAGQPAHDGGQFLDRPLGKMDRADIADGEKELLGVLTERVVRPGQPAGLGATGAADLLLHTREDEALRFCCLPGFDQRLDHVALRLAERHADLGQGRDALDWAFQRLAELHGGGVDRAKPHGGQVLGGAQRAAEGVAGNRAEGEQLLRRGLDAGRAGQGAARELLAHLADLLRRQAGRPAGGLDDRLGAQAQPLELLGGADGCRQPADDGHAHGAAGGGGAAEPRGDQAKAGGHAGQGVARGIAGAGQGLEGGAGGVGGALHPAHRRFAGRAVLLDLLAGAIGAFRADANSDRGAAAAHALRAPLVGWLRFRYGGGPVQKDTTCER